MPTATQIQEAIESINDQQSFIQKLLRDTLDWPINLEFEDIEDITYEWTDEELNTVGLSRDILSGPVLQMQSLEQDHEQPWGIFLLDFAHETPFVTGRGLTGPLRKVLRGLVPKRRNRQANLPAWNRENLLFICTHQYQHFRFAYFKAPLDGKLAPLTTFGWGPEVPVRTACEFNLPSLAWPDDASDSEVWLAKWSGAFDKEKLTKDFFGIFATLYHKVVDDIEEVPALKSEARRLAQLLLDRMLFLYFLQRKGWLNQERDYLYSRFIQCWQTDRDGQSYYSSVLYPLFLSLSNSGFVDDMIGAVPFLNGGLFEEATTQSQTEQIAHARLRVKNSTFKAIFDELLERFNFTVTEDTPLDVEVAIDPEMLGKIFESLILQLEREPDEDLRRLTGSYYTPRLIVHFMCQQALREYLTSQLNSDDKSDIDQIRRRVVQLLELPQADQMNRKQLETLKGLMTPMEAKVLRQAILDCKVCDPAVGSGAFLVGMLHEMVAAVGRLDLVIHGREVLDHWNYYYDLKKQIIESCLYGVDIQEQAVRLCELRLWLSLVVDYELDPNRPFGSAIGVVPSLPNLSYRVVRGDSLLERLFGHIIQLDVMSKDARTRQIINSIQADKQSYFREGKTEEKRRLQLKILAKQADLAERLIDAKRATLSYTGNIFGEEETGAKERKAKAQHQARLDELVELETKVAGVRSELECLSRTKETVSRGDLDMLRCQYFQTGKAPTFMWHVDFAEVFSQRGGFDVVIANPPYLVYQGRTKDDVPVILSFPTYQKATGGKINAYKLFLAKSSELVRSGGIICKIFQNSFLADDAARKIRKFYLENFKIIQIDSFPERDNNKKRVFEDVKMSVCVLLSQRATLSDYVFTLNIWSEKHMKKKTSTLFSKSEIRSFDSRGYQIPLIDVSEKLLLSKVYNPNNIRASEILRCYQGELNMTVHRHLFTSNINNPKIIKGAQVQKYYITDNMSQGFVEYLDKESYLAECGNSKKSKHHKLDRIVMQGITGVNDTRRLISAYLQSGSFCAHSCNYIISKSEEYPMKLLLALLNSKILNWIFKKTSTNSNVNSYEIEQLPLPKKATLSDDVCGRIIKLVDEIHEITTNADYVRNPKKQLAVNEYEDKIDNILYDLYRLNKEEKAIVEKIGA